MRAVVQRVSRGEVRVDGAPVAQIGRGLLTLVGVGSSDERRDAELLADKVASLRIFPDGEGKMNRSVEDIAGEILVVSQFTLYGDVRRGRRPSFAEAAAPDAAETLIEDLVDRLRKRGTPTQTGSFGTRMEVDLVNDGPVTIIVEVRAGSVL